MGILIALGILLQTCFILVEHRQKYVPAVALKGLASLCFVILGFVCSTGTPFARLILWGLIFGMGGDILLNLRYVFEKLGQKIFLVGILIFMIGHIFYLVALVKKAESALIPLGIGIVLAALLLKWIFSRVTAKKAFKIFGIFYVGAVTLMAVVAVWNALHGFATADCLFALGGVLFLISDVVLIFNTFTGVTRFSMRITNLSLYYLGQLLIAIQLLFA